MAKPWSCEKVGRHGRAYPWLYDFVEEGKLNDVDVALYALLSSYRGPTGQCNPSVTTLARQMGKNKRTIQHYLARLRKTGALTSEPNFKNGNQTSNQYFLRDSRSAAEKAAGEYAESVGETPPSRDSDLLPRNDEAGRVTTFVTPCETVHHFSRTTKRCVSCVVDKLMHRFDWDGKVRWKLTDCESRQQLQEMLARPEAEQEHYREYSPDVPLSVALSQRSDGSCIEHLLNGSGKCLWCEDDEATIRHSEEAFTDTDIDDLGSYVYREVLFGTGE